MIQQRKASSPTDPTIVLDVGNTRIGLASWQDDTVKTPLSVPVDDDAGFGEAFEAHVEACQGVVPAAVVISSVSPTALELVRTYLAGAFPREPLIVGGTVPLPMDVSVEDSKSVGTDRVCASAAAYEQLQASCVVIDFGSAVTVDLVDADGVFVGGAISPGVAMQLRSLHEFTAQLPHAPAAMPPKVYGRNTIEAIQVGVCQGIIGAVRSIVEGYATSLNHWPQVIATGGDLALLGPQCDYVDTLVEHLTLAGVGLAYKKHLEAMGV